MKIVELTPQVEERYQTLFQKVTNAIDEYKANRDDEAFKKLLLEVIDETPNVSYLDPDILYASYDMDFEGSQWCEFTEEEMNFDRKMLKELVDGMDEFMGYQLSTESSGSILITLFGDAYFELR